MKDVVEKFQQMDGTMKSMHTQIGQITSASNTRPPGGLPGDTIPNPKGNVKHCNAVILRSGRELGATSVSPNTLHAGADNVLGSQTSHARADEVSEQATAVAHESTKEGKEITSGYGDSKIGSFINSAKNKEKLSPARDPKSPYNFPDYLPPPPFPLAGKNKPQNVEWLKEILKKINVEASLIDLMANFLKFFTLCKELISKKGKFPKEGMVQVSAQCSHILTGRIPPKMQDPGSFHISCKV